MHLLWIAVLIQTLFFIVNDAHFYVLTFIGLSLILQAFSKNPLVFLLVPMIIVHLLFVYWPVQEGFKTNPKITKPNSAPARVDCTRWDTPIAVQAKSIPGPKVFLYR